jgi:hypothetical protein
MDTIISLALVALVGVSSWALVSIVSLNERVAVIENTRFTDEDAEKLIAPKLELLISNINVIKDDVKELKRDINQHQP